MVLIVRLPGTVIQFKLSFFSVYTHFQVTSTYLINFISLYVCVFVGFEFRYYAVSRLVVFIYEVLQLAVSQGLVTRHKADADLRFNFQVTE